MRRLSCLLWLNLAATGPTPADAEPIQIKLRPNEPLTSELDYDLLFFEPYAPQGGEMTCSQQDMEKVCRGTTNIDLSTASELQFMWEASDGSDSKFVSVTGSDEFARTRFEVRFSIENCGATYQDIKGADITMELDDSGLDATQQYVFNTDDSFLEIGSCDGCGPICDINLRVQFDPNPTSGLLDLKFRSISFTASYDPNMVTEEKMYGWSTDSYTWIRKPEGGSVAIVEAAAGTVPANEPSATDSPTPALVTPQPSAPTSPGPVPTTEAPTPSPVPFNPESPASEPSAPESPAPTEATAPPPSTASRSWDMATLLTQLVGLVGISVCQW